MATTFGKYLADLRSYTVDHRDLDAFRANSKQLEAFRCGDFKTAMDGVLSDTIKDHDGIKERYVALVQRISYDRARQYTRPPRRRLTTESGSDLPTEAAAKVGALYDRSDMDTALLRAQQKAIPQNAIVLTLDPVSLGKLKVRSFIPGEVTTVHFDDPMEDDIRRAKLVELEVPVAVKDGTTVYGKRVYTPTDAYTLVPKTKTSPEQRVGIFNPEGTNPFEGIPLVAVRLEEAPKGEFFPPVRLDLLSVQEGLIVALSDQEHIARVQSAGERVLIGSNAPQVLQGMADPDNPYSMIGPDGIKGFHVDDGGTLNYEIHNPNPDLAGYRSMMDRQVELAARYLYANPEGLVGSTGITGAAKEAERLEAEESKFRAERIWARAEQDLMDLVVELANYMPGAIRVPRGVRVHVDYRYVQSRQNDLQEAQAAEIRYARGLASAEEDVAAAEGLTEEEAARLVRRRIGRYRDIRERLGGVDNTLPGLDRTKAAT